MYSERQAIQKGYSYTGIYSWNICEVKERIAKEIAENPKAKLVIIREKPDPLSRSHDSGGYSAYANKEYSAGHTLRDNVHMVKNHENAILRIQEEYNKKIAEENARYENVCQRVEEAKEILGLA